MSYQSRFDLSMDPRFRDRVVACAMDHALANVSSTDVSSAGLATAIITAAENALGLIKLTAANAAFVAVADPSTVTDAQIKSAMDVAWPVYAKALYPPDKPKGTLLPAEAG